MLKHEPMLASEASRHYPNDMYVVEVQKTRGGIDPKTKQSTRPYRFGEFDILAVNMHPSTQDWNSFLFTRGDWLLPRGEDSSMMGIFQPVSQLPNAVWTDKLEVCLQWLAAGEQKRILEIAPELLKRRKRKSKRKKRKRR